MNPTDTAAPNSAADEDPATEGVEPIQRRLRALSLPDRDLMVLLAADHRGNLLRMLPDTMSTDQAHVHLRALKVDFASHLAPAATGYLTDPRFGFHECIRARSVEARLPLIAALEETGYVGSNWDRMPQLVDGFDAVTALIAGATAAKLLVYYHPDASNAGQKREVATRVADECLAAGLPLFLEPLVYQPSPDAPLETGSQEFEDAVVQTAEELSDTRPAVMKVQFPSGGHECRERWQAACERLDAACSVPWVLLGAGVSFDVFLDQTTAACSAGASGVLVGRTIWGETVNLAGPDRVDFLRETGRDRLSQVAAAVRSSGSEWSLRQGARR